MVQGKALKILELSSGKFISQIVEKDFSIVEDSNVLIKIHYSSVNYKDCLSISGHKGVTRKYPHIPGIDISGEIYESKDKKFKAGDKVIVTGYDLGMNTSGGFSQYAVVPSKWVVRLPENLTLKKSMIFGTAGFTASLAINDLVANLRNLDGKKILVTGVRGGVASISCFLLKELGAYVIGSSRDLDHDYLANLPLDELVSCTELLQHNPKALLSRKYDGVIDNLGGEALANIIKYVDYHGIICSCGNVLGIDFISTVLPFILRGITLKGITSANTVMDNRVKVWDKISRFRMWKQLDTITEEISLEQVVEKSALMLSGMHKGRFLVNCQK